MDIGIVSLLMLLLIIVLGFFRKTNMGILAIVAATFLGYGTGMFKAKAIIAGFNSSLFITLLGVTLFFSIVQENGCLQLLMKKIINMFGKWVWMVPILIFGIGWVMAGIGPGCVPALPVIAALAVPLAHETGYNPVMLMIIGDMGSYSGRFTPITPEGILVAKLMGDQGFEDLLKPALFNTFIGAVILAGIVFVAYKGYQVKITNQVKEIKQVESFNSNQIIALGSILVMLFVVIFFKVDIGLAAFAVASILILSGIGNQKSAIKNVPWNTLILVCGVGVLMNLVISTGGIKILAAAMSSVMSPGTAAPVAGLVAGCMSWFSSAMGVVFPTMLSTVGQIVNNVPGAHAVEIVTAICISASCAGLSPASTAGAIIMGAYESDSAYAQQKTPDKLFIELFLWSVFCVVFLSVLSFCGVFFFR